MYEEVYTIESSWWLGWMYYLVGLVFLLIFWLFVYLGFFRKTPKKEPSDYITEYDKHMILKWTMHIAVGVFAIALIGLGFRDYFYFRELKSIYRQSACLQVQGVIEGHYSHSKTDEGIKVNGKWYIFPPNYGAGKFGFRNWDWFSPVIEKGDEVSFCYYKGAILQLSIKKPRSD